MRIGLACAGDIVCAQRSIHCAGADSCDPSPLSRPHASHGTDWPSAVQKSESAWRAPSRPPSSKPCASSSAFIAPALAPLTATIGLASHPPVVLHREDVIKRNKDGSERHRLLGRGDPIEFPTRRRGYYSWHSFCKTQYASLEKEGGFPNFFAIHDGICQVLDQAKRLGIETDVTDESEYFTHRDKAKLEAEINKWNRMVAAVAGTLKDAYKDRPDAIASPITDTPEFERLEAQGQEFAAKARGLKDIIDHDLK